jgi:hypothetical protein
MSLDSIILSALRRETAVLIASILKITVSFSTQRPVSVKKLNDSRRRCLLMCSSRHALARLLHSCISICTFFLYISLSLSVTFFLSQCLTLISFIRFHWHSWWCYPLALALFWHIGSKCGFA